MDRSAAGLHAGLAVIADDGASGVAEDTQPGVRAAEATDVRYYGRTRHGAGENDFQAAQRGVDVGAARMNEQSAATVDSGADIDAAGGDSFLAAAVDDGAAGGAAGKGHPPGVRIADRVGDAVDHGRNDNATRKGDQNAATRYDGVRGASAGKHNFLAEVTGDFDPLERGGNANATRIDEQHSAGANRGTGVQAA
jgi:hypothetical protein